MAKFVLTAELQLQAPKNVTQVVNKIQQQLQGVNVQVQVQNAAKAQRNIQNITKATNEATTASNKMGRSFAASIRRFSALAIATRTVSLFTTTLSGAIQSSIDFERELVKISQVTGKTVAGLNGLVGTISNLSTSLGVSSQSLLSVSRILAQTGLSAKDTQIALGTLAKTELAPTFDNISQTAEGAVAILNQFGQGAAALEAQLGSLNAVAGQFAVEAGDLVAVIRRTGGVFKSAGGDLNELIALFTSVRATTRESAESIATGLRTIFTRIQRPQTIEYLRQFGVELTDIEGKFVGPYEATRRLSQALKGLGERDLTFVQIAEQLGGFRQIGKVLPLLQQFSVAQEALNVAQAGSGSLASDAAKAQAALAVQITKVKEEFLELIRNVTATSTFQIMADTVLSLASAMIKLADAVRPILPLLAGFAAIKFTQNISGFLGGLAGSIGKKDGGKIQAFASGGLVPGVGNKDTVPAMLTPGEFVIKKSSVGKLGKNKLSAMNSGKYNKGGIVQMLNYGGEAEEYMPNNSSLTVAEMKGKMSKGSQLSKTGRQGEDGIGRVRLLGDLDSLDKKTAAALGKDKGTYTGAFLNPVGKTKAIEGTIPQSEILKALDNNAALNKIIAGTKKDSQIGLAIKKEKDQIKAKSQGREQGFNIFAGSLEKSKAEQLENTLLTGIHKTVAKGATDLSEDFKAQPGNQASILKSANLEAVVGSLFEASILSLGTPYGNDRDAGADFDFPKGLGPTAGMFGLGSYAGDAGDAKNTYSSDNIASFTKKIKNFEAANAADELKKVITPIAEKAFNTYKTAQGARQGMGFPNSAQGKSGSEQAQKLLTRAFGGPSGSDTTPALLTPGEFVINKKSAQEIGYGKLNKMNKVGKYAKGGIVGTMVQGFQSGSSGSGVQSGGQIMIDTSGLQSALQALGQAANTVAQALITMTTQLGSGSQAQVDAAQAQVDHTAQVLADMEATQQHVVSTQADADAADDSTSAKNDNNKAVEDSSGQFMGMMMALGAITAGLVALSPTIDENSGFMAHLGKQFVDLAVQATALIGTFQAMGGMKLLADGATKAHSAIMSFQSGAMSLTGIFGGLKKGVGDNILATRRNVGLMQKLMKAERAAIAASIAAGTADKAEAAASATALVADGAEATGSFAVAIAKIAELVAMFPVVAAIIAVTAVLVGFALVLGAVGRAGEEYAKQMKEAAVEAGDVDKAGASASDEEGWKQFQEGLWMIALPLFNLGKILNWLTGSGEKARKAAVSRARAEASLVKTNEMLKKSGEEASKAQDEFNRGLITAGEALSRTASTGQQVVQTQREIAQANADATATIHTMSTAIGDFLVSLIGFSFGFGTSEQRKTKVEAENKARTKEGDQAKREYVSQNQPMMNALQKQVAAAGGSFDDFMQMLNAANPSLAALADQKELREAFANVAKEAERTKKAFQAMNLGFQSVEAAAGAIALQAENLERAMDGSTSGLESTIATLQAGVTSAAQGIGDGTWNNAVSQASAALKRLGGKGKEIKKFEENINAINAAQKFYVNATKEAKENLMAEFQRGAGGAGTGPERQEALAEAIVNQIPDDIGPEVKERILDALKGADIGETEMNAILAGDMQALDDVLKDLGETTMSQVIPALQKLAQVESQRIKAGEKLLDLEDALIDAKQKAIDVELESKDWIEKFGGAEVTMEDRTSAALDKRNLANEGLGLSKMTMDPASMAQRQSEVRGAQQNVRDIQMRAGETDDKGEFTAGAVEAQGEMRTDAFKRMERDVSTFAEAELATKRELMKAIESEIKTIQAKEAAEKKAADALLGGSYEKFVEEMAAQGAVAAAATGNSALMGGFSRTDYGRGSKNLESLEKAGVKEYRGMNIQDLNQRVRTTGLMRGGMDAQSASEMASKGTKASPEVKALQKQGQGIAESMKGDADINVENAQRAVDVQRQLVNSLDKLVEATVDLVNKRVAEAKEGKGDGEGTKGSGAEGSTPETAEKDFKNTSATSPTSMSKADLCCGGTSDVNVVNSGDFPDSSDAVNKNSTVLGTLKNVLSSPGGIAQMGRAAINYGPKFAEKGGQLANRISKARQARQATKAAQASKAAKAATLGDDAVKASTKTGILGRISNFGKGIADKFNSGRQLAGGINTRATGITERLGKAYQTSKNFGQPALDFGSKLADNTVGAAYRGTKSVAGAIGRGVGAVGSGIKSGVGAVGSGIMRGGSYLANSAAGQATGQFTKSLFTQGIGKTGGMLAKGTGGMGASTAIDGVMLAGEALKDLATGNFNEGIGKRFTEMSERTSDGSVSDYGMGALEGFMAPVTKIIEGVMTTKSAINARTDEAKSIRKTEAASERLNEAKSTGRIGAYKDLSVQDKIRSDELAQRNAETNFAKKVKEEGGGIKEVAAGLGMSEEQVKGTYKADNIDDFISKSESRESGLKKEDDTIDFGVAYKNASSDIQKAMEANLADSEDPLTSLADSISTGYEALKSTIGGFDVVGLLSGVEAEKTVLEAPAAPGEKEKSPEAGLAEEAATVKPGYIGNKQQVESAASIDEAKIDQDVKAAKENIASQAVDATVESTAQKEESKPATPSYGLSSETQSLVNSQVLLEKQQKAATERGDDGEAARLQTMIDDRQKDIEKSRGIESDNWLYGNTSDEEKKQKMMDVELYKKSKTGPTDEKEGAASEAAKEAAVEVTPESSKEEVDVLQKILQSLESGALCCDGGAMSVGPGSEKAQDLFNFTKTYSEDAGKGVPMGGEDKAKASIASVAATESKGMMSKVMSGVSSVLDPLGIGSKAADLGGSLLSSGMDMLGLGGKTEDKASSAGNGIIGNLKSVVEDVNPYADRKQANIEAKNARQAEREAGASVVDVNSREGIPNMFLDGIKGVAGDIGADIGRKEGEKSLGGLGGYVGAGEVGASAGRSTAESLVDSVTSMLNPLGVATSVAQMAGGAAGVASDPIGAVTGAAETAGGILDPLGIASGAAQMAGNVGSSIASAFGFGGQEDPQKQAADTASTFSVADFVRGTSADPMASVADASQYKPEGTFDNGGYSAGSPFKAADSASMSSLFGGQMMAAEGSPSQAIDLAPVTSLLTSIDTHLANMNKMLTQTFNNEKTEASDQGSGVPVDALTSIFDQFTSDFSDVVSRLENVSMTVQVQPVEVNINLNGGGILQAVKENVSSQILEEVKKEIQTFKVGDGGRLVKGTSTLPK